MNNNSLIRRHLTLLGAATLLMTLALCLPLQAQTNSKGEEFFIISSVDQKTHQVVLMRPTQLTVAADVTAKTICRGDDGKSMNTNNLQAGDTVWAIIKAGKNGAENLVSIREGAMTETELQKLYLHYSAPAPSTPPPMPVKPSPLNPPPQTGTAQPPAATAVPEGSNAMLQRQHRLNETHHHPHGPGASGHSNP
jgi:hypothetical protein